MLLFCNVIGICNGIWGIVMLSVWFYFMVLVLSFGRFGGMMGWGISRFCGLIVGYCCCCCGGGCCCGVMGILILLELVFRILVRGSLVVFLGSGGFGVG